MNVLHFTVAFICTEFPCDHIHRSIPIAATAAVEEAVNQVVQREALSQGREVRDTLRRGIVPEGRNLRGRKREETLMRCMYLIYLNMRNV